jgi:hypothetical protein
MKTAQILEEELDAFCLEYDNTLGKRNTMRLDASTYEKAIREAKAFLGVDAQNTDSDGAVWEIG